MLKNVDNNVFREMCKNNKKVKKEMSSYLDCEIDEIEIEIEDPTRSSTTDCRKSPKGTFRGPF